jgi:hypothetical protein
MIFCSITDVFQSDEDMSETEVVPSRPLTKRQRAKLNEGGSEDYLELPMGKPMNGISSQFY